MNQPQLHTCATPMQVFTRLGPTAQRLLRDYACRRGITFDQLSEFVDPKLSPNDCRLPDSDRFVNRLKKALDQHERVLIYGDYDCDGIASTAILLRFFHETDTLKPCWALPDRRYDNYGLDLEKTKRLLLQHQPALLICVDCGTNSATAIRWLKEQGVDALVADHHPLESKDTEAVALVNPKSDGKDCDDLCAAGVVFHLCQQLAEAWRCADKWDRHTATILAGMATVADAVSMTRRNRALIKNALTLINSRQPGDLIPGLAALVPQISGTWNQRRLQFEIIPALNALGRLASAEPGVVLLTTTDASQAQKIAAHCLELNQTRKGIQREMVAQATAMAAATLQHHPAAPILILADQRWCHGVAGPAASHISEAFGRSTILLAPHGPNQWKGSGRSANGDHLGQWIGEAKNLGLIERGGGHAVAVGVAATNAQLAAFHSAGLVLPLPQCADHEPEQEIIGEIGQLSPDEWSKVIGLLEPFGKQNPLPLVTADGAICQSRTESLVSRGGGQPWAVKAKFKIKSGQKVWVINRNCAQALRSWHQGSRHDLLLEFTEKQLNGRTYVNWAFAEHDTH
jgi:single-stranded-DNA-specific exonuclease